MIVDSVMHRPIVTADEGASVTEGARIMERHRVGCLVITRGDEAVGIVTERDVVFRIVAAGRSPATTSLREIMSAPIATVTTEASVDEAAALMKQLRVKRLVVMHDGTARGVISVTDIAYASPETSRAMLDAWVRQRWED
ncbi:MAG TPA: CBS domain-containing protein [Candidatus Thermoplasmatota archaeon]|nr:CBS domain-containing protein [Candidatus Thermoplasmatota archaeon]